MKEGAEMAAIVNARLKENYYKQVILFTAQSQDRSNHSISLADSCSSSATFRACLKINSALVVSLICLPSTAWICVRHKGVTYEMLPSLFTIAWVLSA